MIRMASEDIGLADPRALEVALNAADIYERLEHLRVLDEQARKKPK
jgi:replication-associated recombination protein RarA